VYAELPSEITVESKGAVRIVTLNRADQLNATNPALHGGLTDVWRLLAADDDARSVVLTGRGRAFSAGGDMDWFADIRADQSPPGEP